MGVIAVDDFDYVQADEYDEFDDPYQEFDDDDLYQYDEDNYVYEGKEF